MRRPLATGLVAIVALVAIGACDAASPEPGVGEPLWIEDAQLRPGPLPDDAGGPDVVSLLTTRTTVVTGSVRERVRGTFGPTTTGILLGLDPDDDGPLAPDGAWILTAGAPEADTPDFPSLDVRVGLAAALAPGPIALVAVAVDRDGRAGPATRVALIAETEPVPEGPLVVSLSWYGAADLDLHVLAPDGGEAWSGDPNTWEPPPPGTPVDPNAWRSGGLLDHDANAACTRSGGPAEHVVWSMPPPAGAYEVRVDARSLCGAPAAYWSATAYVDGEPLAAAVGTAVADDTLAPHGAGAGALALRFELP